MTSSQELRALESKLKACALNRCNKTAIAEKIAHMKLINVRMFFAFFI